MPLTRSRLRRTLRRLLRLPHRLRLTLLLIFLSLIFLFHIPLPRFIPNFLRRTPTDPFAFDLGFDSESDYDSFPPTSRPTSSSPLHHQSKQQSPLQHRARKRKDTLAKHKHLYRHDGLLETNLQGAHPIYDLIARAERDWDAKLRRASTSLEQAVVEYRRRYGRRPPRGFDLWWNYVIKHNIQLPDQYDQIHLDLEPFWGLSPSLLHSIQQDAERKIDSYTIGKNATKPKVDVLTWAFDEGRYEQLIYGAKAILEMLREIEDELPEFRMVISPHDGPNRLNDWGVREALLEAVESEIYLDDESLPKPTSMGWLSACAPHAPARLTPFDLSHPPPPPPTTYKTFIHTHPPTMSPCLHPQLLHTHGQFLSHELGPGPQRYWVPEFGYCSTMVHHNVRIPVPYGWVEDVGVLDVDLNFTTSGEEGKTNGKAVGGDTEWEEKNDTRLMWRGSNTGMFYDERTWWKESQRVRLVREANAVEGVVRVLYTTTVDDHDENENTGPNGMQTRTREKLIIKEVPKSLVNPLMMDIAFAGEPVACSDKVCKQLKETHRFLNERMSIKEAAAYKYVIDVDGNGWSGRFKRLITSNSLIFKSTIYPEWYTDRIAPWVHYVPIQVDLSDLYDALFFFRGDENGHGAHGDLAKKMAVEGRKWSKTFWRKEDLTAYFYRLILEYARLMSLDREAMSYHGPGSD